MKSQPYQSASQKIAAATIWVLFMLPFLVYALAVYWYATNVPYQDDYDVVLGFLLKFDQVQTLREKIVLLFSQHNEHRIVFDRLIFLAYHYLFHEVNFRAFIMIGNFGWLATTLLLMWYVRQIFHLSWLAVVPIPYLLLSFSHWENMFFAMAGIQNYWFVLFAIGFLIYLTRARLVALCILFAIALFTSGGGIILYPIGNLFLLFQKKWKPLISFFAVSTLCMLFYFYGYYKPKGHPSIVATLLTPIKTGIYFLTFLGNILPLSFNANALLFGIVLASLSSYLLFKRYRDAFYGLLIWFVLSIALVTTLTRSGFGVEQATSSRYSMFPLLLWVCVYVLLIATTLSTHRLNQIVVISTVVGTMFFWAVGIYAVEQQQFFSVLRDERISSISTFMDGEQGRLLYPNQKRAAQLLTSAEQEHLYTVHAGND